MDGVNTDFPDRRSPWLSTSNKTSQDPFRMPHHASPSQPPTIHQNRAAASSGVQVARLTQHVSFEPREPQQQIGAYLL
jgi:hypothetical protein